jgi:nicotinamidase-related amidase
VAKPWDGVITADDQERYDRAGFGRPSGIGTRPALLIIDVQYRTLGNTPKPFYEALEDYSTACGDVGWHAVAHIAELVEVFRKNGHPILYPHVAPKMSYDSGTLGAKVPSIMSIPEQGYQIPPEVAPAPNDIMLPKKHPSAFFGTPLASYLVDLQADSLVVTGCSTSGCVRSTVVDAFAYNYKVLVPYDAVYDRSETVHKVNLFDMGQKYADVMSTSDVIRAIDALPARSA